MQVTDVRVRRVEKEGKMKAIVSITLDNEFVIHDIKVIEGEKGLFIAMPSRKAADGEYRDIAHPINSNTRDMIQTIILNKYETCLLYTSIVHSGGILCIWDFPSVRVFWDGNPFHPPLWWLLLCSLFIMYLGNC